MATRTQKVDFIYHNFTFGGKRMTKKKLNDYPDESLDKFIQKYEKEFNEYLKQPKLIKFLWANDEQAGTIRAVSIKAATDHLISEGIKKAYVVPNKGHHFCKYCGGIAEGSQSDILCGECRDVFGHYSYNEL